MQEKKDFKSISRRHFLNNIGFGGAGLVLMGSYGFSMFRNSDGSRIRAVVVNFEKCAGCRTCEAACAEFNHRVIINGNEYLGPGNPFLSNIKVHHYNPDIDIPSTCAQCDDAPCIDACPVDPDPKTGYRALYRSKDLGVIMNDTLRCIGCQSCYIACKEQRAGVIKSNPETGSPERICTLCNGDPQCVKNCPYDALAYIEFDESNEFRAMAPKDIARKMINKMYNLNLEEV